MTDATEPDTDNPDESIPAFSDDGNATLLLNTHQTRLRYNHDRARWLAWDGQKWEVQPKGGGHARELAKHVLRRMQPTDNEIRTHKKKSLSNAGISNMLSMAETDPRAGITSQELDSHPDEINTPTGIVNLRNGHTTPHDSARLHTRSTTYGPNPDHPTPAWDTFLNETFQGKTQMIAYFQRLAGYAATGHSDNHILPFLFGGGKNGKSVAMEVLMGILGDYAEPTARGLLTVGVKAHETEIADLDGLRLAVASEVDERDQFDEAKVKLLTGGDRLKARFMAQDYFSFYPTHTIMVMGNYQPKVASGGDSFWRRLRIVPFNNKIAEGDAVEGLSGILLTEEGPGIMNWIIEGARSALEHGMQDPSEVLAATLQYSEEEDTLGRFFAERCIRGDHQTHRVLTSVLITAYSEWCRTNHEDEISANSFGRRVKSEFNAGQIRPGGFRAYTGVALAQEEDTNLPGTWMDKN